MTPRPTDLNEKALKGASKAAQHAFDAFCNPKLASVPIEERTAWAMTAIIHCDMCRLIVVYAEIDREGLASLLSLTDMVSKLFEAKRWYFEKGDKLLCNIAKTKKCGEVVIRERLIELRKKFKIGKIENYSNYRNKFGYHYDSDAIEHLVKFGQEDSAAFFELVSEFAKFSGEWAMLTKSLIKNEIAQQSTAT